MKKVLIGICLLVGCGDAGTAALYGGEQASVEPRAVGSGGFADEGEPGREYAPPAVEVPCAEGEVNVVPGVVALTDSNNVPLPRSAYVAMASDNIEAERTNVRLPFDFHNWDFVMLEAGKPLTTTVAFTWSTFEGGEFDGEDLVEVEFGCDFTLDDLVAGDGYIACDTGRYVLHIRYELKTLCPAE